MSPPDVLDCSKRVNPFATGNPFLGTKLLGFSIGRGSGDLKGLIGTRDSRGL